MKLIPIPADAPAALSRELGRRGLDFVQAEAAARGQRQVAFVLDDVTESDISRIVNVANDMKLDVLSGDTWVFLAGPVSRTAALFRRSTGVLPEHVTDRAGRVMTGIGQPATELVTARGVVDLSGPIVCGIVNVTPDSFSDGGLYLRPEDALKRATELVESGARMLDIGAESTRPGAEDRLSAEEEWARLKEVLPVACERFEGLPISVDTVNSETASRALDTGAWIINDVSGARLDPEMGAVCATRGAGIVLMHSRGEFDELASYDHAQYDDLLVEVTGELNDAVDRVVEAGVGTQSIAIDPGLGFGKKPEDNFRLLSATGLFVGSGLPVMVGPSRKRFLGAVTGSSPQDRDIETAAAAVIAAMGGAHILRVHDVAGTVRVLAVARAAMEV